MTALLRTLLAARMLCCGCCLAVAATVQCAGPPLLTNDVAAATNDPLPELFQQQRASFQQVVEELRREITASSKQIMDQGARHADALSQRVNESLASRLELIQRGLAQRQERELETLRDSNRTFLMVAGLFAGLSFLGIVLAAAILARAINRFSEVAMSIPTAQGLGRGPEPVAIGAGELRAAPAPFDQANARFGEAMARLEKRIKELEVSNQTGLIAGSPAPPGEGDRGVPANSPAGAGHAPEVPRVAHADGTPPDENSARSGESRSEASVLLGKGQALLNLGQVDAAIECFDKAIALEPTNADAFVKKGMAMERLQRMEEAIENYNCAIAVNSSLTLAYLYKGAVCNRLQRFREALECYEKALKSEQKPVAA
jgi:tetratricopeptide (TPR) repeat protein